MPKTLIGIAAVLFVAAVGSTEQPSATLHVSNACGMKVSLPRGWTRELQGSSRTTCEVELSPPRWRADPDCPERLNGRILVTIVSKPLRTLGGRVDQEWLRAAPECESGWYSVGEGGSCLYRVPGRAAALTTESNFRLYCSGTYEAQEIGSFGVVFGERRVAFVMGDARDAKLFDRVVASLRP